MVAVSSAAPLAQVVVTTPRQQFGHDIGADYVLPDYTAFTAYCAWSRSARPPRAGRS
jgi:hypothetical protein